MSGAMQPAEHVPDTLCAVMGAGRLVLVLAEGAAGADVTTQASAIQLGAADLRLLAAAATQAADILEGKAP